MKKSCCLILLTLLALVPARAMFTYEESFTANVVIPDANPTGVNVSGTVSDVWPGAPVLGLTVGLNISGGFNGDLYVALTSPSGVTVVLINQPGVTGSDLFGYGGSGLNVILSNAGLTSIQTTPEGSGVFSGTYQAAGDLTGFNGSSANGTWNLFFADLSGGDTSTLNGWSLSIEAVPEPEMWGAASGLGLLGICGWRLWRNRRA